MPPPGGGGSSVLVAMTRRYAGTPVVCELTQSMRIADQTGAFVRNLDRICEYNDGRAVDFTNPTRPRLLLEWTSAPSLGAGRCPFVFARRGATSAETVQIIRSLLIRCGAPPDDPASDYHIIVHTNNQLRDLAQCWYAECPVARDVPAFREHDFRLGERVMFLENDYGGRPRGSRFKSEPVMNGTVGTLDEISDENAELVEGGAEAAAPEVAHMVDTAAAPTYAHNVRWLHLAAPLDLLVSLDRYRREGIIRAQPATGAKMQGQETGVVVVYIDHIDAEFTNFTRRALYTMCARGKTMCVVVGGCAAADARGDGTLAPCPDPDFERIVCGTPVLAERTAFWKAFPPYASIAAGLQTSPRVSTSRARAHTDPP